MSGGKTALGLDVNVGAMLCHIPVCCINFVYSIIVLLTEKDNKFVRFCAIQDLLLWVFWILVGVPVYIVGGTIISFVTFGIGSILLLPLGFLPLGVGIFLAVKAYGMQKVKLPVIGDLAEQWS
jgi:uncharacterized membrane protein